MTTSHHFFNVEENRKRYTGKQHFIVLHVVENKIEETE